MKKITISLMLSLLIVFFVVSTCYPVQLVCIGLETARDGICDIWDVVSIHDDDVQLGGPGYADSEIIWISNMPKSEFMTLLYLIRVETERFFNSEGDLVKFWFNEDSNPPDWYEIHIQPKYRYTIEDFTQQDIATLADEIATTSAKATIISKIKDKITMYPQNRLDTVSKQK